MRCVPLDDDIGPDDGIDLDAGVRLPPNPDAEVALSVPFSAAQLGALRRIAGERGISSGEAVQRLVEEALEARAHRPAA